MIDFSPLLLATHGAWWSYLLVGALAFGESVAFIGLFVPGSILLITMGALASRGALDLLPLFFWSSIGAILGDYLSYWLGRYGMITFRPENRFFRPEILEKGKRYVHIHGPKSVFFGRFIGWVRPIVPFVVGTFHLDHRRFLFWNVTSGILWSIAHITFGYFISSGLHRLGSWAFRLEEAIFLGGALIILGWTLYTIVRKTKRTGKTNDPA